MTASHRELSLDALERLSVDPGLLGAEAVGSCRAVVGAVVLATCNRFELYVDVDSALEPPALEHAAKHSAELVARACGLDAALVLTSFTLRTGPDVAHHLFEVASGLDSLVVGEREIAGQIKRALATAREAGATSKTLELLFQTASRTSKRVAAETDLGSAGRSVVALGLELAGTHLPPWRGVRAVLIGTGSYAGASLAALHSLGCKDVRVYSPSGRAKQFAADRGAQAVDDLLVALEDADLVLSCSGARGRAPSVAGGGSGSGLGIGHVLDAAAVVRARARATERVEREFWQMRGGLARGFERPGAGRSGLGASSVEADRPLVVLDLALHRDVDPLVADVEGVLLYDLAAIGAHSPALGAELVDPARAIVDDAAVAYERTRLGRGADAAVMALLDEAEEQIAAEVAERLAQDGPEADVEAITRRVRRRVHSELHSRIVAARQREVERSAAR